MFRTCMTGTTFSISLSFWCRSCAILHSFPPLLRVYLAFCFCELSERCGHFACSLAGKLAIAALPFQINHCPIGRRRELKLVVSALYFASRPIINVVAVSLIIMSMFAIAGVQLYAGQLDTCRYVCRSRGIRYCRACMCCLDTASSVTLHFHRAPHSTYAPGVTPSPVLLLCSCACE